MTANQGRELKIKMCDMNISVGCDINLNMEYDEKFEHCQSAQTLGHNNSWRHVCTISDGYRNVFSRYFPLADLVSTRVMVFPTVSNAETDPQSRYT